MWGKASRFAVFLAPARITPAHVGKRKKQEKRITATMDHPRTCGEKCISEQVDHPRTCGEKKQFTENMHIAIGSPPHMRGKVK